MLPRKHCFHIKLHAESITNFSVPSPWRSVWPSWFCLMGPVDSFYLSFTFQNAMYVCGFQYIMGGEWSKSSCFVNPWGITAVFGGRLVKRCYLKIRAGGLKSSYSSFYTCSDVTFVHFPELSSPSNYSLPLLCCRCYYIYHTASCSFVFTSDPL